MKNKTFSCESRPLPRRPDAARARQEYLTVEEKDEKQKKGFYPD